MKILYYSAHPNLNLATPSGYGTHMREMIAAFRELSHEVLPVIMGGTDLKEVSNSNNRKFSIKEIARKITPNRIWESIRDNNLKKFDNFAESKLKEAIKKFQPDLIYERANYLQLSGVKTAKEMDIPHVLEVNSPYVEEREYLSGKSFFLSEAIDIEKQQLEMTDQVVVVSSALKNHFSEKHNIEASKFLVTPNAINPQTVKVDSQKTDRLKTKFGLKEEHTVIGFIGSIFPWHGVDMLIKAFIKLKEKQSNIVLLIVGSGAMLEELRQLADKSLFSDEIIFVGKVSHGEIYNYVDCMDIAVSPNSGWYQSPIKIFEYGALGKAIVAPDKVPLKDVMVDGVDAILNNSTVEGITNSLERLLDEPKLLKLISENFQKKVFKNHTWLKNAELILASELVVNK